MASRKGNGKRGKQVDREKEQRITKRNKYMANAISERPSEKESQACETADSDTVHQRNPPLTKTIRKLLPNNHNQSSQFFSLKPLAFLYCMSVKYAPTPLGVNEHSSHPQSSQRNSFADGPSVRQFRLSITPAPQHFLYFLLLLTTSSLT